MAILLAGGCSFTLGNELSDHGEESDVSQLTWSALLAKELGMDYKCVAKPGASNQTIARLIIDSLMRSHADAVAIMWTFTSRYEYHDRWKKDYRQVSIELSKKDQDVNNFYHICGDDEVQELHTSFTSFLLVQEFLKNRRIPYLFTMADTNPLDRYSAQNPNPSIASLIKSIDWSRWFWINQSNSSNDGFYHWGQLNYPCGPMGHPLESAHSQLFGDMLPQALTWLRN